MDAQVSKSGQSTSAQQSPQTFVPLHKVILVGCAAFSILIVLQTLTRISDSGDSAPPFLDLLLRITLSYPPWLAFAVTLFAVLERRAHLMASPRAVVRVFLLSHLLFYAPNVIYEVSLDALSEGDTLASVPQRILNWPGFIYFIDYVFFCGVFAITYGLALTRGQIERDRRNQQLQSQMLKMQLQLEHQRLAAIQAQLEPHFLFNALNAISGLVRSEEKKVALTAIARLSELLRYTLGASRRDWVSLAEELHFVRDYLSLQSLRHGDRLKIRIDADEDKLQDVSCPPLLLQPLVENALRHDLETHQGDSDIELRIRVEADGITLQLSNPISEHSAPNPGLGLGLSHTRERLRLRYDGAAKINAQARNGRFHVDLWLPDIEHD